MTENVLVFPKDKIVREAPLDDETVKEHRSRGLKNFCDSIAEELITIMVTEMSNYGIDVEEEQFMRDFSLTAESLRATLYRSMEIPHSLHPFIDNHLDIREKEPT